MIVVSRVSYLLSIVERDLLRNRKFNYFFDKVKFLKLEKVAPKEKTNLENFLARLFFSLRRPKLTVTSCVTKIVSSEKATNRKYE